MHLLANRRPLEWTLRFVALAALAWLIVGAFRRRRMEGTTVVSESSALALLPQWSRQPPADSIGIRLTAAPSPMMRDWLLAIRRSGTAIAWADSGIPRTMLEVEPRIDPAGGLIARFVGPSGGWVTIGDALGPIDSLELGPRGATVRLPDVSAHVSASMRGATATAAGEQAHEDRHIAVLGGAGWEAKFITRALEERGWQVDARFAIAPGLFTEQGKPFPLDTARQAAIIVLDATAGAAGSVATYLRNGGGVILVGAPPPSLKVLAAGQGRSWIKATSVVFADAEPRSALRFAGLAPLAADAIPLESRGGQVAVAARRIGPGRLIQVGYDETWRWRMQGGAAAVAGHRAWWANLVAGVAYRSAASESSGMDPAPMTSLALALGEPSRLTVHQSPTPRFPLVLAVLVLCLLGEWTSRRMRGDT